MECEAESCAVTLTSRQKLRARCQFLMFSEGAETEGAWNKLAANYTHTQHLIYVWC